MGARGALEPRPPPTFSINEVSNKGFFLCIDFSKLALMKQFKILETVAMIPFLPRLVIVIL